jgi:ribosomal protein S8
MIKFSGASIDELNVLSALSPASTPHAWPLRLLPRRRFGPVSKFEGRSASVTSRIEAKAQGTRIELKYFEGAPAIQEIQRVSKPGRRVYSSIKDLRLVRNGLGISIISTPKGVMSDNAARDANVGGEILCEVY